jgi:hypothetical protein
VRFGVTAWDAQRTLSLRAAVGCAPGIPVAVVAVVDDPGSAVPVPADVVVLGFMVNSPVQITSFRALASRENPALTSGVRF